MKALFESKLFQGAVLAIIVMAILLGVFKAGMIVGERKSEFSFRWGDNYNRNFVDPRKMPIDAFGDKGLMNPNGSLGEVIAVNESDIVIKDKEGSEKIVLVKEDTEIRKFQESIKITDLKVNDQVVVFGKANDSGQIEAKLIRIMPALNQK